MNDQQPPAAPPPGWGPPPSDQNPFAQPPQGYHQPLGKPPLPGLAVVFLVFNIIVALFCGMVDLSMHTVASELQTEEGRARFKEGMQEMRDQQLQNGATPEEMEGLDHVLSEGDVFLEEIARNPQALSGIQTAHLVEIAIKGLLLLGAALLFARTGLGRMLTLLSLTGWLVVNVYWASQVWGLYEAEGLRYGAVAITGISMLYPLLALLVLGLSGGVRRACQPAVQPGQW